MNTYDENYSNHVKKFKFKVRKISLDENGNQLVRYFIELVYRDTEIPVSATRFGDACLYKEFSDHCYAQDKESSFYAVTSFLNDVLIDNYEKYLLTDICEINIDVVKDYLRRYSKKTNKSCKALTKNTVIIHRNLISNFLYNLCLSSSMKKLKKEEIIREVKYRERNGITITRPEYLIKVVYPKHPAGYVSLNRDMPSELVERFIDCAKMYDPEIAFAIVIMAYAGLRIGEVVNLRGRNSCYGGSFYFQKICDECTAIEIDLSNEYVMRSDLVVVGKIKKERRQSVCPLFTQVIYKEFKLHEAIIRDKDLECYGPLFTTSRKVNGRYMALTENSLRSRLLHLFWEKLYPTLEHDGNNSLRRFYYQMKDKSWGPHSFRHWFSVQIVLAGYDEVQLMNFRGDRTIESARKYLERKGELERVYRESNEIHAGVIRELTNLYYRDSLLGDGV